MTAVRSAQGAPPENKTTGVERAGRVETQKQRHFTTPTTGELSAWASEINIAHSKAIRHALAEMVTTEDISL